MYLVLSSFDYIVETDVSYRRTQLHSWGTMYKSLCLAFLFFVLDYSLRFVCLLVWRFLNKDNKTRKSGQRNQRTQKQNIDSENRITLLHKKQ